MKHPTSPRQVAACNSGAHRASTHSCCTATGMSCLALRILNSHPTTPDRCTPYTYEVYPLHATGVGLGSTYTPQVYPLHLWGVTTTGSPANDTLCLQPVLLPAGILPVANAVERGVLPNDGRDLPIEGTGLGSRSSMTFTSVTASRDRA